MKKVDEHKKLKGGNAELEPYAYKIERKWRGENERHL